MCESTPTIAPEHATTIHVAVGVVTDGQGRVLIAKRPEHAHQGGLWEFPGGKVEAGESLLTALDRELFEELDIQVLATEPVIEIIHDYGDKVVRLDVHRVSRFSGEPRGKEGQPLLWVRCDDLPGYDFPAANAPILQALSLPDTLCITGSFASEEVFIERLKSALGKGLSLVQLRAHELSDEQYLVLAQKSLDLCDQAGARLLLNRRCLPESLRERVSAHGLHLDNTSLANLAEKPEAGLVGASCHSLEDLQRATALGLDYATLSPVAATASHPQAAPMGWARFAELVRQAKLPVYALGGMKQEDLGKAKASGAQGIAAIRAFWAAP